MHCMLDVAVRFRLNARIRKAAWTKDVPSTPPANHDPACGALSPARFQFQIVSGSLGDIANALCEVLWQVYRIFRFTFVNLHPIR
jgi:hypothetical protein